MILREKRVYRILILGASFSGNADGRAMVDTLISGISSQIPNTKFTFLCKYPKDDVPIAKELGHEAFPFTTVYQLFMGVPFFALGKLLSIFHIKVNHTHIPKGFAAYFENDILVDMTGISFSSDRPLSSLIINVLWFLPAFISNIPSVKISNSMGPFKKLSVRRAAKYVLPKIDVLIARGDISYAMVRELLPQKKLYNLPDIAFGLTPCKTDRKKEILRKYGIGGDYIVLGPSYVVDGLAGHEKNMDVYSELILRIRNQYNDIPILLVPHSRAHSATLGVDSFNDDVKVCRSLLNRIQNSYKNVYVVDELLDAHELKALIGGAVFVVGSRYHLLIASLSSGTPCMALGWSHKYEEAFRMLGVERWVIRYEQFDVGDISNMIDEFMLQVSDIRAIIESKLPAVLEKSRKNTEIICDLLRELK